MHLAHRIVTHNVDDFVNLSFVVTVTYIFLFPCSEEDDALYEKLSGEQWRLECLMQLLAELKDSELPGAFFLDLLQVRTAHISTHNV